MSEALHDIAGIQALAVQLLEPERDQQDTSSNSRISNI